MNWKIVWSIRIALALLFLFAGGMKLAMPAALLAQQTPLPVWFVRCIGVAEISGAIGLLVAGLTRAAAVCLSALMVGATILTVASGGGVTALLPFTVGTLAVVIAVNSGYRRNSSEPATPGLVPVAQ
jgi:putative oxidoreductase